MNWTPETQKLSSLFDKLESSFCSFLRKSKLDIDHVNWSELFKGFDRFGRELINLRNRRIEELFNSGISGSEIAKKIGISTQRLSQIKHRLGIETEEEIERGEEREEKEIEDEVIENDTDTDADQFSEEEESGDWNQKPKSTIIKRRRITIRRFAESHCPYKSQQSYPLKRAWRKGAYSRSYRGKDSRGKTNYKKDDLISAYQEGWDFVNDYLESSDMESLPY